MQQENRLTAIPEMKVETRLIYQRGRDMYPGEVVDYGELNELIGCDVQKRGRGYLNTARRRLLKDHGINIECIFRVGIKRMEDKDLAQIGASTLRRIRRATRRASEKMTPVDLAALTDEQKTRHLSMMSGLSVIAHISRPKEIERLEPVVRASSNELPVGKVLAALQEANIR